MFEKLTAWMSRRAASPPPVFSLPDGMQVAAIGDIHGEIDLLRALLERIEDEYRNSPEMDHHIIFLGDYVDRGPDTCGTIEFLLNYNPPGTKCHFLKGNHEDAFTTFLAGDEENFSNGSNSVAVKLWRVMQSRKGRSRWEDHSCVRS